MSGSFGRLDFQLMLLRRMADYQPGLVEDKVAELGLPRSAVRMANQRWQATIRSRSLPDGSERYRRVLGRPVAEFQREFGDAASEVTQWETDLWPPLLFEIIAVPGGPVLHEWLVRPEGCPAPALAGLADLRPWECVVADVERALHPVQHADDGTTSRWATWFRLSGSRYVARFAWGLLQVVELAH